MTSWFKSTPQECRIERARKRILEFTTIPVYRDLSEIPNGGCGLYSLVEIHKGDLITEYGGEVLTRDQALKIPHGYRTHFRTLDSSWAILDGSIHESHFHSKLNFSESFYLETNQMASFANDPHGTDLTPNVEYYTIETTSHRPYPAKLKLSMELEANRLTHKRVFLRALRDIPIGEEILVNYGRTYWSRDQ